MEEFESSYKSDITYIYYIVWFIYISSISKANMMKKKNQNIGCHWLFGGNRDRFEMGTWVLPRMMGGFYVLTGMWVTQILAFIKVD